MATLPVTAKQVAHHIRSDVILGNILHLLKAGWPNQVQKEIENYFHKKVEISVENDCLLWDSTVIIAAKLREAMIEELHEEHQGIVKMKALVKLHFWWPHLYQAIEDQVKRCQMCQSMQEAPAKLAKQMFLHFNF